MKFRKWFEDVNVSFPDALALFGYKPGDFVDGNDYGKRFKKLAWQNHPDIVGGNHEAMVKVNLANNMLKPYVGQTIPGGPTAQPRPEPSPNWADTNLHGTDRRSFGKWLHGGIINALETAQAAKNSRTPEKLVDTMYKVGEIVGQMMRAFNEWKLKSREMTSLDIEDFHSLMEPLDTGVDSAKELRAGIKNFIAYLHHPFYDKYIKDFPPHVA